MILSFVNIRKVPREMLKTSGFALGFQHLPRVLANVNEWKIMFDPYISWENYLGLSVGDKMHLIRPGNVMVLNWTKEKSGHLRYL